LKELGIKSYSIIYIKTKTPINNILNSNSFMRMNPYPSMGMNFNPIMGMNVFQNMENIIKDIKIIFHYTGKVFFIQAKSNSPFYELANNFCKESKIQDNNLVYLYYNREIPSTENKTLNQLYMYNYSEIDVLYDLAIIFSYYGKQTLVQAKKKLNLQIYVSNFFILLVSKIKNQYFYLIVKKWNQLIIEL